MKLLLKDELINTLSIPDREFHYHFVSYEPVLLKLTNDSYIYLLKLNTVSLVALINMKSNIKLKAPSSRRTKVKRDIEINAAGLIEFNDIPYYVIRSTHQEYQFMVKRT